MDDDPNALSVANQRTLFLVNTFVIHTVRLLNNFSVICEDKLADVHRRILRADATLYLLEAKLRSVDGLEGAGEQMPLDTLPDLVLPAPAVESSFEPEGSSSSGMEQPLSPTRSERSRANSTTSQSTSDQTQLMKVKDNPLYAKFFRMLQVGVPLPAVKIQMNIEGFDPSLLDAPDAASPVT
ncbi:WASH complex subunit CCDC53 [Marchantia polymorpha subsp. ruderalis]|uniref:WASH complex subunit 3 n=1 Tax=Marchantia polymorpha TaxID=3197 RepID=A0A2R6XGX4_MARPO|nr:hypothetical protein MARPO_0015s0155 [Marchantia polymorpha]BBN01599.1 hypothetical protein Mp_2g08700 [Marchantia polymorpha subsp. ruderalis]|eukprot:PTQ45367.1 hypothetical protein MARPO_0015s0155 [Marchantia polymorpha]